MSQSQADKSLANKARYARRAAQGACVRCEQPCAAGSRRYCALHLKQITDLVAEKVAERQAAGLCVVCGQPRLPNNMNNCERHRAIRLATQKRYLARRKAATA